MTLSGTLVFFTNSVKACHIGSPDWWVCCFEIDCSGCTSAMTPVLGEPNVTAFLKALSLHRFCSTCTPTTCQLHVDENSFTLTTYVSPFKANRASARADTQMTHRKESNTESGHNTKWLITANGPLQS